MKRSRKKSARIIGISGKSEAGKSTLAGFIKNYMINPEDGMIISFAGALKSEMQTAGFEVHKKSPAFRGLAINWGLARRIQDPDYFITRLINRNYSYLNDPGMTIIIDDVRFQNEYDWIEGAGGVLVRVEREWDEDEKSSIGIYANSASETELDWRCFHAQVTAKSGSLWNLKKAVPEVIELAKKKQK